MRHVLAFVLLCAAGLGSARAAVDESDLLPVDEAFALSATAPSRDRIELRWKIADGYYLYRHRTMAEPVDGGAGKGVFMGAKLQLPHGQKHQDEFFGEVETFRRQLVVPLIGTAAAGADKVTLTVKYQGCADLGVCYPPQQRTVTVKLPALGATLSNSRSSDPTIQGGLTELARSLGNGNDALPGGSGNSSLQALPLAPERAFGFEAIVGDGNTVLMRFTPAKGYYLYRDRTSFALTGAHGITAGKPNWPKGMIHHDEHFGDMVVYFDQVEAVLPLRRNQTQAANARLTATFQGCQDQGICYPPMTRTVALAIPAGAIGIEAGVGDVGAAAGAAPLSRAPDKLVATAIAPKKASTSPSPSIGGADGNTPQAEDSRLAALLAGSGRLWALLVFFALGLGLAFTPCVLPMIPILSGLIAGQGTRLGTGRALTLSLVYVVASALVFTIAGVVAGLAGANLQVAFQNPWIIAVFAGLFVALALSSFGLYELQLPTSLRARLGQISDSQRGGSLAGTAALGALSALIVGPCVAPPLAAAVLYIGQTRDPVFGGAALFLLAMGMGTPLLAFGVAAGRGLPQSGPWMTAVQRAFGFVFLGLAVWMLSRIVPATASLALWGTWLLAAAAWTLSTQPKTTRMRVVASFIGLLLAVLGAFELLGAATGGADPLQPLARLRSTQTTDDRLIFRTIKASADLDRELVAAQTAGQPVLLDFYADWCVSCKEMEKYTFSDPAVHAALTGFTLLQADVTANDATDQALMRRFGIIGPPATLFFRAGRERRELRLVGYEKSAPFVARADRASSPG